MKKFVSTENPHRQTVAQGTDRGQLTTSDRNNCQVVFIKTSARWSNSKPRKLMVLVGGHMQSMQCHIELVNHFWSSLH
jgi:hypothetical protein